MPDDASIAPVEGANGKNLNIIMDVLLNVTAQLGTCDIAMRDVLELKQGTVLRLDQRATDPILVCLNGRPVAKGEVVVVDECFGIKITGLCD